jgi:serine protease DegQ
MPRNTCTLAIAALTLALVVSAPAHAAGALPAAVDGQALPSLAPMLERVTPAVVNVNSKTHVQVRDPFLDDPFFRRFFGVPEGPRERVQQSLGSGVVVDAQKGYVLTNNHVVENADDIAVTLHDGRTLKATKVGADPDSDVAVIQIEADKLTALPLADSANLRVGDFVVAVGNPFGLGQTVTSGIVSALGRTGLQGLGVQNFIQTDASINPGNSGGALVNLRGELIGINTAIYSPSGGNVGIGFAIPANMASDVMRQLLSFGEVRRGALGIQAQDLDEELASLLDLEPGHGAVVTRVLSETPAENAGLRAGDVITAVNGKAIGSRADLANVEGLLPVGAPIALSVTREGKPLAVTLTLKAASERRLDGDELDERLAGTVLSDAPTRLAKQRSRGVTVQAVEPDSRAARNGLEAGDVIVGINQREVGDLDDIEAMLENAPRQLLLTVVRGRGAYYVLMR